MPQPSHQLTERLIFRTSLADKQKIQQRAVACGLTLSAYLRLVALGTIPRARPNQLHLETVYHLSRIGNNLNQLTKGAHQTRAYVLSHRLEETLTALEAVLRKLAR